MLKQSTTYHEQIEKLREHGCEVSDEDFCVDVLKRVSYYRFSAYLIPFKTESGKYKSGTDFVKVYSLYEFDRKLRQHIFSVIEELEVYLRAQLSYYHTQKYGSDGYMDSANFNSRHNHAGFAKRISQLIKSNSKVPFVKHHMNKYGGQFPLWALTELFTFGMLSYFFADMKAVDQKHIAFKVFDSTVKKVESWLYCCTNLRNMCAHYGRLYCSVFSAAPAQIQWVDKTNKRTLFAALMALRELYPNEFKWNYEFMPTLISIFGEYYDVVDLRHIGFPEKWENIVRK